MNGKGKNGTLTYEKIDNNHVKIIVNQDGKVHEVVAYTLSELDEQKLNAVLERRRSQTTNGSK